MRVEINDLHELNMSVAGGGLVDGINPTDSRRYRCTSGFVVTDGSGRHRDRRSLPRRACLSRCRRRATSLPFIEQFGLGYQDVQINLAPGPQPPLFYSDRKAGSIRKLATWRNVASTRAGDFVCHWGEISGYSCAEVQLTDYAPPGTLCGGPCEPTWVTVPSELHGGRQRRSGVHRNDRVRIAKGINRTQSGACNFYYYMSTDYLPTPWRVATAPAEPAIRPN